MRKLIQNICGYLSWAACGTSCVQQVKPHGSILFWEISILKAVELGKLSRKTKVDNTKYNLLILQYSKINCWPLYTIGKFRNKVASKSWIKKRIQADPFSFSLSLIRRLQFALFWQLLSVTCDTSARVMKLFPAVTPSVPLWVADVYHRTKYILRTPYAKENGFMKFALDTKLFLYTSSKTPVLLIW